MVFGRMYSSRILPSAVNEFDSSDWLIRIYRGADSIILVRSQEGYTSQCLHDPCTSHVFVVYIFPGLNLFFMDEIREFHC